MDADVRLEMLRDAQQLLYLVFGAVLGFSGSLIMWQRTAEKERKATREAMILRMMQLAFQTTTYTRALIYAKAGGVDAVRQLPSNPVDEIMAICSLHVDAAADHVQALHDKLNEIFEFSVDTLGAAESTRILFGKAAEIEELIRKLNRQLLDVATKEKLF